MKRLSLHLWRLLPGAALIWAATLAGMCEAASPPAPCAALRTLDISAERNERLFLAGQCALEQRQFRSAARLLEELVALDDYPVYRAELGRAYLGSQEFERARTQFLRALESHPPQEARNLLHMFIQMADQQQTQAREWVATATFGLRHDSNVNTGPLSADVTLFGLPFVMSGESMPKRDSAWLATLNAVHIRPLGGRLAWQSRASLELVRNQAYHQYDTTQVAIDTGPHWAVGDGRTNLYLPLGLARLYLNSAGYARTLWLTPQVSRTVGSRDVLIFALPLQRRTFDDSDAMSSHSAAVSVAWRHTIGSDWTLEPSLRAGDEDATDPAYSNRTVQAGLALRGSLPWGLRLSLEATHTRARYQAAEVWAEEARKDARSNLGAALSKDLGGGYYATLSWNQARIRSNLGFYSSSREQWQAQLTKAF